MGALQPLLLSDSHGLEHQDRLFLFEAAGNVLGAEGLSPQTGERGGWRGGDGER